jgi:hypothetical protein
MRVHHLNGGLLHAPPNPPAACHCLLLALGGRLALVDTGIGLHDIARPAERIGQAAIDAAGFRFEEPRASLAELRRLAAGHAGEVELFGYHDFTEFPPGVAGVVAAGVSVG